MRKILSFVAAMLIAFAANAAVINISPTSPQQADNLRLALNGAATGDTIVMAAGTYVESPSDYIAFTGKEVTVMAAEGAEVILQPKVPIRLKEGAVATFIGIKFDCGHLSDVNSYENLIVPADDTEGKTVILSGCEFYGWTQVAAIIRSTTARRLSAVTIDKCYFHDVMKSCLFLENTNEAAVAITNSTFANVATSDSYSAGVIDIRATAGSLNVNQCTFYNVLAMNTDYAAVGKVKLASGAAVSNCIFAMPTEAASSVRTIRDVVAATNILVYNYTADSGYGMQSNVTKTNCVIGNPLFKDAANGDYTLGEGSPALTMNDGAPIGDPRWAPAPAPIGAPAYYLVGNMNNWKPDSAYKFAVNPANENEYMLNTTLAVGDSIKVLGIVGNTQTWYPENAPNYGVDAAHAGKKTIYFQTTYKADWAEFGGYIWMEANPAPQPMVPDVVYSYVHVKKSSNSDYATAYDVTVNGMQWSVTANLATDASTRFGGKSLTKVDKPMYTKQAMANAIDSIIIRHGGVSSDKLTVNSVKLEVASDAAFANILETKLDTPTVGKNTAGIIKFALANAAANSYYRITYNLSNSNNSNYAFMVTGIDFYGLVPEVKYYLKNNWDAAADWTWKEMTKVGKTYKLENVVFGGQGVNVNTDIVDAGAQWIELAKFKGDTIAAKDTVTLVYNPADTTITATLIGKYVEPVSGCDWDKLEFIGSADAQYANQFKVCKAGEQPEIVNIQKPGFAREIGIYMTFPSAEFDYTSFDTTKCDIQGAGIIFHLSAFTAKVTDLAVVCGNTPILFSVYNDKGIAPAEPKFYVTGDSALVTDAGAPGKAWDPSAIVSMEDTLVLKLKANVDYLLKVTLNGTWEGENNVKGYNELTEKTEGLNDVSKDHNIGFKLTEAGEVKVVYNDSTFKLIGNFYVEPMDTIPTTAPAAPTVAENNVMAIYCNHYTTNNANFAISGWAGTYQTLTIDSTKIAFWKDMTWECVIDPVNTDAAHDFSEYKKLHVDIWAPKAAQIKFTVEAVAGGNYKDGKVVSLAKGWNSFDFDLAEWPGKYDFKNVKCFVLEQYSIEHTPFAIANIYFYDKPQWAAIKFTEVVPKDSLAADASFILLDSDFKAQITDTDNKMEIDANACRFGSAEGYDMFTHRLKSGGKSSAKNFITLTIPEDGKLAIAVRTGSNSATDRNLVIKQGNDTLFNQLILESQAIKVMEDTVEVSVYPYVSIPVEAGNVVLSYPVGSLNFYAFAFKPEPIPVYYMKNNWNEGQWLWREMTRNGMSYKLDSVVYGGNGVNYNTAESDEGATWVPDSMILGDEIAAKDTVSFVLNPIAKTVTANLVGKYVKPADQLSCAEIYALADSASVLMNGVVVTYVNGSNIFVKDETGAMLIYLPRNTSVAWKPGDILSNVRGIKVTYNGLVEVSPKQDQVAAVEAIAGYAPAPEELTFVNDSVDMNKYIIVKGIEFDADTAFVAGKNGTIKINLGNQAIDLFNKFKLGYEFKAGKKYDIVAIVSYYNALQLYFVSAEAQVTTAYYLAGTMNGWTANEAYMFTANPANEGEYMLTTALAVNDEFKVIGVEGTTTTWYPDGMGNNYKVDDAHAGEAKTIYFRPEGGQEGWYAGYFFVEENELVKPTTAPAAPTAAEDDVLAIYCDQYKTNNLHFGISGWAGAYEVLDIDSTKIGYWTAMTWECIIDPINTDAAHDLSGYKKLHVDLWAPKAAQIQVTVEAVANYKDGQLVDLVQGWNSVDFVVADWKDGYDFKNVKCFVFEKYNIEGKPFAFANIYFYDKEAQGIENTNDNIKAIKRIENGMIIIEKNGKKYTITGQLVK